MHMRDERTPYGPQLMAYVDAQLANRDESPTAFAVERVGVSASQFGRWRAGEVLPRLDTIVEIAEALGRPVLEVLAHAVDAVDQLTEPIPPQPQTLEDAIRSSDLAPPLQELMLDVLDNVRKYAGGEAEVTATDTKHGRANPRPNRRHGT